MYKHRYITVLFLLIITSYALFAQTRYPIYVHPVLTPPYSLRISDYGQAGSTRLVIHVNVNDFTVTNLPVRLHIKMENLSGGSIETHPNAAVMPIYLNGGEVRIFFGEDLAPYFNIDNLVFSGYSKEQYRRTGQLQEGFYRITVHVRHFLTGRIISNEGPAMGWFALGKPPQLISPNNDAELGQVHGSPLVFSWQHSSPAVPGAMIQYNFEMWDLRLPEISPYVYVNSMPAMHSSTERMSPLQIYPAMLNLEPGMKYAWRVTAFDMMNQVPFEQDGKSEVRTFTYLSKCDAPTNLRVEQKGKDAVYTWDADSKHTSYTVEAENVTTGFNNIYTLYDNKKTLKGLDYGNEYRLRVRAVCNNNDMYPSDFSDWKTFRLTPPPPRENNFECGEIDKSSIPPITNQDLRRDLKEGDIIYDPLTQTNFRIKTAEETSSGVYKGLFYFMLETAGIEFLAQYEKLRVNTDNIYLYGEWETVRTLGFVADIDTITDALTGGNNSENGNGSNNGTQDTVQVSFNLSDNLQVTYNDSTGIITLTDENGNEQTIELPKDENGNTEFPITIVDGSGDTYIVTKDENGNISIDKKDQTEQSEEFGDAIDDGIFSCGCSTDVIQSTGNGDCKYIYKRLSEIKDAYYNKSELILYKTSLKNGRLSIVVDDSSVCIENLYYDMSLVQGDTVTLETVKSWEITQTTTNNLLGSGAKFWAIKFNKGLEIKILESEVNSEAKIKALEKWLLTASSNISDIEDTYLNIQWYGQFDEIFKEPCGCWPTDGSILCDGKTINNRGNVCCNRAAKKIMTNAGTTPNERLVISQTNRPCTEKKDNIEKLIHYDDNGITANKALFEQAVQVIDISLKEHKLPIMIGVQHPYIDDKGKWYYKCGSILNDPRATNHFVVIVGKGYDETKKMWFYYFYEVAADNVIYGTSKANKLWISTSQNLIMGNVSTNNKDNYYIVTDVRKNQNKIYNAK